MDDHKALSCIWCNPLCRIERRFSNPEVSPRLQRAQAGISCNGGRINPAAAIGRIACENGILYLLDACQAAGQTPIDVNALGCDILTATWQEISPRAAGNWFHMRKSVLETIEPAMIDLDGAPWTGLIDMNCDLMPDVLKCGRRTIRFVSACGQQWNSFAYHS